MDRPFEENIRVCSYDTDMNSKMTVQNLVKYFMETAIVHSDAAGFPVDRLLRENRGWVVLNWVIKMKKYPVYNDELKIETWAKPGNTLQATRYFVMSDLKSGETVAEAASRWAFLDLENRHPVRFSLEMEEAYCYDRQAPFDPGRYNPPAEKEGNLISEREITVRRSETDTNGHTNNTRYVEWAMDDVPDDIYESCSAEEIRVLYRKECRAGDKVRIKTYLENKDDGTKLIITSMADAEGTVLCKMSALWRKNEPQK